MITTSVGVGSGKFTWCTLLALAFTSLYPCNSIIDPFHYSPFNFSFHNFGNRLAWPPRRLQMGAKQPTLRNYYGFPLFLFVRAIPCYVSQTLTLTPPVCTLSPAVASFSHKGGRGATPLCNTRKIHC